MRVNEIVENKLPPEVENHIDNFNPDDVGVDEVEDSRGNLWIIHVEGFTDECQASDDYCANPEAVFAEVWSDHEQRQGKPAYKKLMVGSDEYPIIVSVFKG